MTHLVRLLALAFLTCVLLCPQAQSVTLGRPVTLTWDYAVTPGSGAVVTGFIIQACQASPSCTQTCTPTDVFTVSPATFVVDITTADVNVIPGASYRYQVVAAGTLAGVPARSTATAAICVYVPAKKRGSPTPIAP